MKKILKSTFIIIILIITISLIFFVYSKSINSNLSKYENFSNKNWNEFFGYATKRTNILSQSIGNNPILHQAILKNLENRDQYTNACSDEYVYLEYELNEILFNFMDTVNITDKKNELLKEYFIHSNDSLNHLADQYNQSVFTFNNYKYRFPNVLIATQKIIKQKNNLPFNMVFAIKIRP